MRSSAGDGGRRQVTRFKVGDLVGVGCMVDSCRTCAVRDGPGAVLRERFHRHLQRPRAAANTYRRLLRHHRGGRTLRAAIPDQDWIRPRSRRCCAPASPPIRRCALEARARQESRHRRPRRPGPHGRQASPLPWARMWCCSPPRRARRDDARAPGRRRSGGVEGRRRDGGAPNSFDFILNTVAAPHDLDAFTGPAQARRHHELVGAPSSAASVARGVQPDLQAPRASPAR